MTIRGRLGLIAGMAVAVMAVMGILTVLLLLFFLFVNRTVLLPLESLKLSSDAVVGVRGLSYQA